MDNFLDFKNWCAPLMIYAIFVLISAVLMLVGPGQLGQKLGNLVINLVIAFLVGWLIKWLCESGHVTLAWVLVFLPLIIYGAFALLTGLIVIGAANRLNK